VSAPIDDRTMDGAHKKMDRQQQEHPPMGGKSNIERNIAESKQEPDGPGVGDPVHQLPLGVMALECFFRLHIVLGIIEVNILGMYGHVPDIFKKMRGMRVFLGITVCVMHTVHDGICPGIKKGRALHEDRQSIKKALPKRIHRKHFVGSVAMEEKSLTKKG
jgi:hypothetical protein